MKRTAILLGAAIAMGFPQPGVAGTDALATTGQAAGNNNGFFDTFGVFTLNNSGQVAFEAILTGTHSGNADNNALYMGSAADPLLELARRGSSVPGGDGLYLNFNNSLSLNDAGQLAFVANLSGTSGGSTDNHAIYRSDPTGGLTQLARKGLPVPGGNGVLSAASSQSLNSSGQVAFGGFLTGTSGGGSDDDAIILSSSASSLSLIARGGQPSPDTNGVFAVQNGIVLNDSGLVLFSSTLTGTSGGTSDNEGVYLAGADGGLIQLARAGAAVPGGNGAFSSFANLRLNASGRSLFSADLTGTSGGTADNAGLYRTLAGGALQQVVREGQAAPGGDGTFGAISNPQLNDAGDAVFISTVLNPHGGGTSSRGIYHASPNNSLTAIALEGQSVVGGDGVYSNFSSLGLNETGQIAFVGSIDGTSGGTTNNQAVYLSDGIETIQVVREGDAIGNSSIINLTFSGDDHLNNAGQLAYVATRINGDQALILYTPDLHWRSALSGSWDVATRWTVGIRPEAVHDVFIDPDVSLTVNGPSSAVSLNNLTVGGGNGIATLSLNGGTITSDNAITIAPTGVLTGDGTISGGVTNLGTVLADNLTITGTLTNNNLITGDGRINATVSNDGRIEAIGTAFTPAEMRFDGVVTNNASTGLVAAEHGTLRFNAGLTNHGAVAVSFGTSRFFGDINNTATGNIVLSGGSNTTFYDDIANNGSIIVAAAGPVSSTAVFFGDVSGSGSITGGGSVFLHGDLRPGNSPAAVFHDVELFLMSTVSTQIELGGTTPGTQHDQINNLKSTALGGTLDIQLINGFDPVAGETFDIFNFASQSGTFSDILLPLLDAGLGWHLGELYTEGELHVELAGDLNLDGFVGVEDLDLLLANWGDSALAFDYAAGDASGDGLVGNADLQLVLSNFGNGTPAGGNVPEPGSLALLALGGLALLRRRR